MDANDQLASQATLNFTGVEEAQGSNITQPGTIAMFKITAGEYVSSQSKGTPGIKFTFEEDGGSSFTHTFWLTPNALGRIQHLTKHAAKQLLTGQLSPANVIASLKGKILPLKVTAQINAEKGRVYPDLPFGGFSADAIGELKFSQKEIEEIEKGKTLSAQTSFATADKEGSSMSTATKASAEDF